MSIFSTKKPRFVSHRGFTPLAPDNSLPAFYYAGLLGQWAIETDVRLTRDGNIVCCHSDSVEQYCNESGKISEMTLSELRRLEIANGNRVECFGKDELRIPLFSEYLSICKKFGCIPFIELKTDDAQAVISSLRRCGFADDEVIMSSTSLSRLAETRQCSSDMFVHWIFAKEDGLNELSGLGSAGLSYKISDPFKCSNELIERTHSMGLRACLRAADSVESLARMRELGLDYYPTNKMHGYRTDFNMNGEGEK